MSRRFVVTFRVPAFAETERLRAIDYWRRRRVRFKSIQDDRLEGTRGTLWGNASSFDMSCLMSRLLITWNPSGEVVCELCVSSALQIITAWNEAWLQLELENFRHNVLYGDEREAVWRQFQTHYQKHVMRWTLTGGFSYHHLPDEVRGWLMSLSAPEISLPIPGSDPPTDPAGLPMAHHADTDAEDP